MTRIMAAGRGLSPPRGYQVLLPRRSIRERACPHRRQTINPPRCTTSGTKPLFPGPWAATEGVHSTRVPIACQQGRLPRPPRQPGAGGQRLRPHDHVPGFDVEQHLRDNLRPHFCIGMSFPSSTRPGRGAGPLCKNSIPIPGDNGGLTATASTRGGGEYPFVDRVSAPSQKAPAGTGAGLRGQRPPHPHAQPHLSRRRRGAGDAAHGGKPQPRRLRVHPPRSAGAEDLCLRTRVAGAVELGGLPRVRLRLHHLRWLGLLLPQELRHAPSRVRSPARSVPVSRSSSSRACAS